MRTDSPSGRDIRDNEGPAGLRVGTTLAEAAGTTLETPGWALRLQAVHETVRPDPSENDLIASEMRAPGFPTGSCVQVAAEEQEPVVPRVVEDGGEL